LLAGILSALCLWFAWRAFQRCREIQRGALGLEPDPLERRLAEAQLNLELNLARRNVQVLGRAALFGGAGMAFWVVATGQLSTHPIAMWRSFAFGLLGWGGCGESAPTRSAGDKEWTRPKGLGSLMELCGVAVVGVR